MSDEFIPPTTFPARYRTRGGYIAEVVAKSRGRFAGHLCEGKWFKGWEADGSASFSDESLIGAPLSEEPETVSLWAVVQEDGWLDGICTDKSLAQSVAGPRKCRLIEITSVEIIRHD